MSDTEKQEAAISHFFRATGVTDARILDLLMVSVGRVLLMERRALVGHTIEEHMALLKMTRHIRDWLAVAVDDKAKWLSNVDDLGRPKKLMKFSTIEAICLEADRQMERKQRLSGRASSFVEGEEEFLFDAGDGWSIVRLLTPAALDRESEAMQHCIGHGAYDEALADSSVSLLSLRDPYGKPHVTIEVRAGSISQFQGKQNQAPTERYQMRCLPYFNAEKISSYGIPQLVTDVSGMVYSIYDLPEVLESVGNLSLHNDADRPLRLPRSIKTTRSLRISGDAFSNTPDEVVVGENLHIDGTALASTPASFSVDGSIILMGLKNVALPSGLRVEGNLTLTGSSLTSLPSRLFVRDVLGLEGTNVAEIPSDLRCGSINISKTAIRQFDTAVFWGDDPNNRPARSLVATNCGLEEIVGLPHFRSLSIGCPRFETPKGLVVEGTLKVYGGTAKITAATKSLGGLFLENCNADIEIEDVNDAVTVRRSTVRFGKELRCGGIVEVRAGSTIERAPERIKCELLILNDLTIASLPKEIIARDGVMISDIGFPRLDAVIRTANLSVHPSTTFFGEGIEANTVTVTSGMSAWRMGLSEIKAHLSDGGDLHTRPAAATILYEPTSPRGSGKTSHLAKLLAATYERPDDRLRLVTFDEPIDFPEAPSADLFCSR